MKKYHEINELKFKKDRLIIQIDGERHEFELRGVSPRLFHASKIERDTFEISPSGYGIHWPIIDEDISIDGLLGIQSKPQILKKTV